MHLTKKLNKCNIFKHKNLVYINIGNGLGLREGTNGRAKGGHKWEGGLRRARRGP